MFQGPGNAKHTAGLIANSHLEEFAPLVLVIKLQHPFHLVTMLQRRARRQDVAASVRMGSSEQRN